MAVGGGTVASWLEEVGSWRQPTWPRFPTYTRNALEKEAKPWGEKIAADCCLLGCKYFAPFFQKGRAGKRGHLCWGHLRGVGRWTLDRDTRGQPTPCQPEADWPKPPIAPRAPQRKGSDRWSGHTGPKVREGVAETHPSPWCEKLTITLTVR